MEKPWGAADFLNFSFPWGVGEKSATAAVNMPMSIRGHRDSATANISRALVTSWQAMPRGSAKRTPGPHTACTSAPRSQAQTASAAPINPLEGLVQNRTPSHASRVGPRVTRTFFPAMSCGERACRAARKISCRGASLPSPCSPQAVLPQDGGTRRAPRRKSRSTLSLVAGCDHMRGFMAGASTRGPSKARACAHSMSAAAPAASRDRASAEAGATTRAWAFCPGSRWAKGSSPAANMSP